MKWMTLVLAGLMGAMAYGADLAGSYPIAEGPFKASEESMKAYQYPEWFRDAKFGIWSHWGPQAVPRNGDWYARKMYMEGDADYKHHLEHYGHPSKFGYKDIIPLWKAERWDPEALMALYKKAGAKYFVSMGSHHDNFPLWNDKFHKWNSVNMGPKKDVVGLWQAAAKKNGLKFGVSEHLGASMWWFQTAHGADKKGPMAGVPYDGNDPQYQDLYHPKAKPIDDGARWYSHDPEWQMEWYKRIKGLIDDYQPDLLYSDGGLPFAKDQDDVGRRLVAHYYNQDANRRGGTCEVVYNCKQESLGQWVQDLERGVMNGANPHPWQTDTSIGDWYYRTGQKYKTTTQVVHMLADIVSKNGNLLINVVQTPEGDLEPDLLQFLEEMAAWTSVNGEAIYATRPFAVFGEASASSSNIKSGGFNEDKVKYTGEDIRFTTSKDGKTLYAIVLGWPESGKVTIKSLASGLEHYKGQVGTVELLGNKGTLSFAREAGGLVIELPKTKPCEHAYCFKITAKAD